MIIIRLMGGLGNQMFQYALGKRLALAGKEVKYDLSCYEQWNGNDTPRDYMLDLFPIQIERAGKKDIRRLYDRERIGKRIYKKLTKRDCSHVTLENSSQYLSEIDEYTDRYLIGFWQNERYFSPVQEVLREDFHFPEDAINERSREVAERIMADMHAVSVHIRGTDYLSEKNAVNYGGICTADYYRQAADYVMEQDAESRFYVFSDDAGWAEKVFGDIAGNRTEWITGNRGKDSWIDMYLMSLCRNHIIANSSYSWWGAWLGRNKSKVVIGPRKWSKEDERNAVMPQEWNRI